MTSLPPSPLERIRSLWPLSDEAAARLRIGMDSSRVSRILDGSQSPTSLDYALIAEACQVTVDWLLTGKGAREINPIVCRVEEVRLPSVRVYTDAEDAEMLGEADPHDPNCWSNQ